MRWCWQVPNVVDRSVSDESLWLCSLNSSQVRYLPPTPPIRFHFRFVTLMNMKKPFFYSITYSITVLLVCSNSIIFFVHWGKTEIKIIENQQFSMKKEQIDSTELWAAVRNRTRISHEEAQHSNHQAIESLYSKTSDL